MSDTQVNKCIKDKAWEKESTFQQLDHLGEVRKANEVDTKIDNTG